MGARRKRFFECLMSVFYPLFLRQKHQHTKNLAHKNVGHQFEVVSAV